MNGIIILNKPINISSHDAVNKVRKILKIKKVGHTGTLDPLATGVLIICVGDATKLSRYLTTDTKKYRANITLGFSTKTYDLEGEKVAEVLDFNVTDEEIDSTINSFIGKSKQLPPIYSAIKVDGKKLYEYALKGEEVEIEERDIEVFSAKRATDILRKDNIVSFSVDFDVSKGTYIRSIANDFGIRLGIPSVLSGLERVECSGFTILDSVSFDDIMKGNYKLYNMCDAIGNIYQIINDEDIIKKAKNGMKISYRYIKNQYSNIPERIAIIQENEDEKKLVAIYVLEYSEITKTNYYKAETVWN